MERKNPLVSVIINCYNGEKYLREAIDSVIAQTYSNWEIIFWDNQSTDSSAEIVKSYNDDRIKYYRDNTPISFIFLIASLPLFTNCSQTPIFFRNR